MVVVAAVVVAAVVVAVVVVATPTPKLVAMGMMMKVVGVE